MKRLAKILLDLTKDIQPYCKLKRSIRYISCTCSNKAFGETCQVKHHTCDQGLCDLKSCIGVKSSTREKQYERKNKIAYPKQSQKNNDNFCISRQEGQYYCWHQQSSALHSIKKKRMSEHQQSNWKIKNLELAIFIGCTPLPAPSLPPPLHLPTAVP